MGTRHTKERLFEVMRKTNPDFVKNEGFGDTLKNTFNQANTKVFNAVDNTANAAIDKTKAAITNKLGNNFQLLTYGDLQKVINVITGVKKGELVGGKIANAGVDFLLGLVPGLSMAKSSADVYKAMFQAPDDKKTNTWLDKMNVDDDLSAIVDDTVENGFLLYMSDKINNEAPTTPLPQDFDINAEMVEYLRGKYNERTIAGVPPLH